MLHRFGALAVLALVLSGATGTGRAQGLDVHPDPLQFGPVVLHTLRANAIFMHNTGTDTIHLESTFTDDTGMFHLAYSSTPSDVAPGLTASALIEFLPTVEGDFVASFAVGYGLPVVEIRGTGYVPDGECTYASDDLDFGSVTFGEYARRTLQVTNDTDAPLYLAPVVDSPHFTLGGAPILLRPGYSHHWPVFYEPTGFGHHEADIWMGICPAVHCSGFVESVYDTTVNLAGLFFDDTLQNNRILVGEDPVTIPCYLALINPTETSGVAGWECQVGVTGGAMFVDWQLEGNALSATDPPVFTVGLGLEPLPYAPTVLLATGQLHVYDPTPDTVSLRLIPTPTPTIPYYMAWVPWHDLHQQIPVLPFTLQETVAWVNHDMLVGVEAPAPRLELFDGTVVLTWTLGAAADGCRLYRRAGDGVETLRAELVPYGVTCRLEDPVGDIAPGTQLSYRYETIRSGIVRAASPMTALTLPGTPALRTRLLPNIPNPFNPQTTLHFTLDRPGRVRLGIYDAAGRLVAEPVDALRDAGPHAVAWDGSDRSGRRLPSGTYFLRLETDGRIDHRKVLLLE